MTFCSTTTLSTKQLAAKATKSIILMHSLENVTVNTQKIHRHILVCQRQPTMEYIWYDNPNNATFRYTLFLHMATVAYAQQFLVLMQTSSTSRAQTFSHLYAIVNKHICIVHIKYAQ